jgi:hypothetical protein
VAVSRPSGRRRNLFMRDDRNTGNIGDAGCGGILSGRCGVLRGKIG